MTETLQDKMDGYFSIFEQEAFMAGYSDEKDDRLFNNLIVLKERHNKAIQELREEIMSQHECTYCNTAKDVLSLIGEKK